MTTKRCLVIFATSILLVACGTDQDSTSGFALLLTDAPGDFEQVPIQIKAVEAYRVGERVAEGEKSQYMKADGTATQAQTQSGEAKKGNDTDGGQWVKMMVKASVQQQDLLKLQNGKTAELGNEKIPAGYYNRIRLKLASAQVVVDGKAHDLDVPAEGIELQYKFQLKAGEDHEMTVDFDAKQSIQLRAEGNGYEMNAAVSVQQFRYRHRSCEGEGDCDGEQTQAEGETPAEGEGDCKDGACASAEPASEPKGEPSPDNNQP